MLRELSRITARASSISSSAAVIVQSSSALAPAVAHCTQNQFRRISSLASTSQDYPPQNSTAPDDRGKDFSASRSAPPRSTLDQLTSSSNNQRPSPNRTVRDKLPQDFFSKMTPPGGIPSLVDLDSLAPSLARMVIPMADSPYATRLIYLKTWSRAFSSLERAFNKSQMFKLAGPAGLNLDYEDPRMRPAVGKARFRKFWVAKKSVAMNKKELIRLVLIMRWGMIDPEHIPGPSEGTRAEATVELSDRDLFLLLAKSGTTISSLTYDHQVKLSFSRDPAGVLSLIIRGFKGGVEPAKEDILSLKELAATREFLLPKPITTLRPEMYQNISRLAEVYFEEGKLANQIKVTAGSLSYVMSAEHLLRLAFIHNALDKQTPIFAALPNSPISSQSTPTSRYGLYPFVPPVQSPWMYNANAALARVTAVSTSPLNASSLSKVDQEAQDLQAWSERMKFERTTHLPLDPIGHPAALASVRQPFESTDRVELRGTFGHVVWPQNLLRGGVGLGPTLDGVWPFTKFIKWNTTNPNSSSLFVPEPPPGFLATTGALTPVEPRSPFLTLLSAPAAPKALKVKVPVLESSEFRRIVYRPVVLASRDASDGEETIEIELEPQAGRVTRTLVRHGKAGMMVPDGSIDFQMSLTSRTNISQSELLKFEIADPGESPPSIVYDSATYLLDTDRFIRRTVITPPPSATPATPEYQQVLERWSEDTFVGRNTRGVSVQVLLGESENNWNDIFELWKKGQAEMERIAKIKRVTVGAAAATSNGSSLIFRSKK